MLISIFQGLFSSTFAPSNLLLRHGHVLKITPVDNDQGVIVHFASRRDAENAFNRGTNYYGQIMKIDWYEESHATGDGGGTGNEEEGPHETDQGEIAFSSLLVDRDRTP